MCLIHRYNHNNDNRFITKNNSRTFTIEAAYFHINEAVDKKSRLAFFDENSKLSIFFRFRMIDASTADLRDPIDRNRRFSTASRYLGALERLLEEKNKSAVGLEVTGSIPTSTCRSIPYD